VKTIVCQFCRRESEITFEPDEDLPIDEPIFCPFCGEPDSDKELLLEQDMVEWDE
jgi:sarcosine oxidase delta subunit